MKQKIIQYLILFCLLVFAVIAANAQELKLEILNGHSDGVLAVAVSSDGKFALTGSMDWTALLWDLETGKQLRRFVGHELPVTSVSFSKDGQFILTASMDKTARLWRTATGKEVRRFIGHTGKILSVAISSDGRLVATASDDKTARIWNLQTGKQLFQIEHAGKVNSIAFSPDSLLLLTGGEDKIARLYSTSNGELVRQLVGHTGEITSVAYSPDGKQVLTGSYDRTVRLWNVETATGIKKIDLPYFVSIAAFTPSGRGIVTGGAKPNSNVQIWDIKFSKEILNISGNILEQVLSVSSVAMTTDEKQILISDDYYLRGIVEVFDVLGKKQVKKLDGKSSIVKIIEVSPNSQFVLSYAERFDISLWDSTKGQAIKWQQGYTIESLSSLGIKNPRESLDSKISANLSFGTIYLENKETGGKTTLLTEHSYVNDVAFSPDGKTIAVASDGYEIDMLKVGIGNAAKANGVRLFDFETGKEIEGFGGEFKSSANKFAGFKSVAYSPDKEGRYIAAGSFDGKVYLRENETKTLRKFDGHTDTVNSVKFAKDANGNLLVVSGSSDSTTRIWNAETGEEICALVTFRDGNWAVVQTSTGRYDAPNGGEIDGIQWVFGNEVIALNQLKDIYYTPNLLPRLLGYNKEPLAEVRPLSNIKLFPEIIENNFDKTTGNLTVKLKNRDGGIGAVRVMVNDKLAIEDARSRDLIKKLKTNPNLSEAVVIVNLKTSAGFNPTGENRIEVFTNDFDQKTQKSFVSSNPKTSARGTEVFNLGDSSDNLPQPTLYAIVGGVSDYNGSQLDLNFAAKDAEMFAVALGIAARRLFCPKENPNCEDKVKIKLLTTNDAANLPTKPNFRAAFAEVAKNAKPEDILVVYLAGHGTSLNVGDAETYFFLTQESEIGSKDAVGKNPERAISNAELLEWLTQEQWRTDKKGIDARNQVLILDTCAAGAFENALTKTKQRDLSADQIRALEKLKDRTGLQILMGSAANQSAYEASQYGQGLLTYALLEGVKGAALEKDRVETGKLFDYAVNRVPKMDISNGTTGLQSPRIFGSTSIPIGLILTKEDKDAIKIQASPLPIFGRPSLIQKGENDDTLELGSLFTKKLDEAASPNSRGSGGTQTTASLVFVDERNFPGAYRVTATYTEENGIITLEEITLKKDGKTVAPIAEKISAKDADEAARILLEVVLKEMKKL